MGLRRNCFLRKIKIRKENEIEKEDETITTIKASKQMNIKGRK